MAVGAPERGVQPVLKARRAALTQGDFDSVLGWKKNIQEAVSQMLRDQSPKSLYEIRQLLYASLFRRSISIPSACDTPKTAPSNSPTPGSIAAARTDTL